MNEQESKLLEKYLSQLENSLEGVSVNDKLDILMEIRSHIEDRTAQPDMSLAGVLKFLGTPETLANRYRLERGLSLQSAPKTSRWPKYLFIGSITLILSIFVIICLGLLADILIIKTFVPLFENLFGKAIESSERKSKDIESKFEKYFDEMFEIHKNNIRDIDSDFKDWEDKVTFSYPFQKTKLESHSNKFASSKLTAKGQVSIHDHDTFAIKLTHGNLKIQPSKTNQITYRCVYSADNDFDDESYKNIVTTQGSTLYAKLKRGTCDFYVPRQLTLKAELKYGNLSLLGLAQNQFAKVSHGNLTFSPRNIQEFNYTTKVNHGTINNFPDMSLTGSKKYRAELKVKHGNIMYSSFKP